MIERLTAKLCEREGGAFSTTAAVVIKLRSPDERPHLLDLPGIVRSAVAGQSQSVMAMSTHHRNVPETGKNFVVIGVIPA